MRLPMVKGADGAGCGGLLMLSILEESARRTLAIVVQTEETPPLLGCAVSDGAGFSQYACGSYKLPALFMSITEKNVRHEYGAHAQSLASSSS